MVARHAALSIGALLVLGLGVYLLVEVRAQPVPVAGAERAAERDRTPPDPPAAAAPSAARPVTGRTTAAATPVSPRPAAPAAVPRPPPAPSDPAAGAAGIDADALVGPRLDAVMDEANKAYDRGDFDDARTIASRLLAHQPGNVRMLRIMVSASCIDGDAATAQAHFAKLPPADQAQMRTRCARYGIAFADRP